MNNITYAVSVDVNNPIIPYNVYVASVLDSNVRYLEITLYQNGNIIALSNTATATASLVTDNVLVNDSVNCTIQDNIITVPLEDLQRHGNLDVQVTVTEGERVLAIPFPIQVRVAPNIAENAQINENSLGSYAEVVQEIAAARGTHTTLHDAIAAKLSAAPGAVDTENLADESITVEKVADDLAAVINAKEEKSNKKTTLTGNESSNDFYPTTKAVHDAIENLEAIPDSVKLAMDTLFSKAAYADDDAASSYATFHAWAISNLVTSITAVFTQGSATIHDTDSLDTLKQYLTVTATYSDSTTATVTDYTLSGTLTEGTSTVTVSYGGKTTTFSVTVTEGDGYSVEYQGNFTTASPSNTRVTLITNDVTLSEGETVTFSVPSGYKIFALQSYATGGNSAIDRTAKDVNQIYVNCVSSSGYIVPKDTIVCNYVVGIIPFNKRDWVTEVVYTKGSGTATVSGIGFFVQKYVNEEAVELSIAEAKSVVSIAYA